MADPVILTPDEIQKLGEPIESIYTSMANELMLNIGKHITAPERTVHTAAWEIQKLSELGQLTKENARIINRWIKDIPELTKDTLEETRKEALARLEREIGQAARRGAETPPLANSTAEEMRSYLVQTAQGLEDRYNRVNTTMLNSSVAQYTKAVHTAAELAKIQEQAKETQKILNQKTGNVITGVDTLRTAKRDAILQIAREGLTGFYDKAGRKWSPEAYVNMDIRTTVHNTAIETIATGMNKNNVTVFQVSSHAAARPLCYPYQGKFYSWGGFNPEGEVELGDGRTVRYEDVRTATSYGEAAGLFGINCGHYPIPIVPGVTIPHGADDIQPQEENDKAYKESQKQRAIEREIRNAKRDLEMLGETATDEDRDRLKKAQEKMRGFISDTGRTRRPDREEVYTTKAGETQPFKFPDLDPTLPRGRQDVYREFATGEQATEFFDRGGGVWTKQPTAAQKDALEMYATDAFEPINQLLRGELTKEEERMTQGEYVQSLRQAIRNMDAGLDRFTLNDPIRVYRSLDKNMLDKLEQSLDGTYTEPGYMSTSATPRERRQALILQIDVPSGAGHGAWIDPFVQYGGDEYEFLLPRSTTITVDKEYVNDDGVVVFEGKYVSSAKPPIGEKSEGNKE